jgi:hypothetical protein
MNTHQTSLYSFILIFLPLFHPHPLATPFTCKK